MGNVVGLLEMVLTTYETVERRALKNLLGMPPRKKVVVHWLPEWLAWTLAVNLELVVMDAPATRLTITNVRSRGIQLR